jgi:nucleotide-binding universal stress UspA family protein
MIQSLLVPLDGSEFSERTLPLAHGLAKVTGASLHLAHVHVTHAPDHFLSNTQFQYEGLDLEEYESRYREQEKTYLSQVELRLAGAVVDSVLLEGSVQEQISAYATDVGADMVVMTTHGHTGVSRMWLGSVADALIRRTTLPILVVHPGCDTRVPGDAISFKHILVPLDGSDLSASILPHAKMLATATGARLTLLHVVSSTAVLGARIFPLMPDDISPAKEKARTHLESVADSLRSEGLDAAVHVQEHEAPARAIAALGESMEVDLIALATHGYGGLKRALLGSVADKVLRSSSVPLLVKRPG